MAQPAAADSTKTQRLHRLRAKHRDPDASHLHPVNKAHYDQATRSELIADELSAAIGSWPFIIVQSFLMVVWIYFNVWGLLVAHWDPYPFILLNLVLSLQATYAGPIVLLAGNRQAQKDRLTLEHASDEADKGEEHVTRILVEIRRNTELTLRILEELEAETA